MPLNKELIRILHIVDNISVNSGVSSVFMNLFRNIDRNKVLFDFLIIFPSEDNYEEEIKELGGKIYYVKEPKFRKLNNNSNFFKTYKDFTDSIKCFFEKYGENYKAVHSHTPTLSLFFFTHAKKCGIQHRIIHSHSIAYSDKNSVLKKIRNYLLILLVKHYTNIYFACSDDAGLFLFGHKMMQKKRVKIIKNGIDIDRFDYNEEIRAQYRQNLSINDCFVIGCVGRFVEIKNQSFLLDIFKSISMKMNNARLMLIGAGELKPQLELKAHELGILKDVLFLGVRKDVPELYQSMDCLVMPSIKEGFGVVAIEAQASGMPVFLSDGVPNSALIVNTTQLKLTCSASFWANQILSKCAIDGRASQRTMIQHANYDIRKIGQELSFFYTELI